MKEVPNGWVKCSVGESDTAFLAHCATVLPIHVEDEYGYEYVRAGLSKIFSPDWDKVGIIPVKKAPPQKPKTIELEVKAPFPRYDIVVYLPDDWYSVKRVRVTEIMEDACPHSKVEVKDISRDKDDPRPSAHTYAKVCCGCGEVLKKYSSWESAQKGVSK